jgi:hypothetical protein
MRQTRQVVRAIKQSISLDIYGINQQFVSAARWQHGSRLFLKLLFNEKTPKLLITEQPVKLEKK